MLATLKRRSVLFLISDFLGSPCTRALKAAAARHDVIVVEIVDPRDQELPASARWCCATPRPGETALVDAAGAARRHAEQRGRERGDLARLTRKLGVDRLELRTDRPYLNTCWRSSSSGGGGCGGEARSLLAPAGCILSLAARRRRQGLASTSPWPRSQAGRPRRPR